MMGFIIHFVGYEFCGLSIQILPYHPHIERLGHITQPFIFIVEN